MVAGKAIHGEALGRTIFCQKSTLPSLAVPSLAKRRALVQVKATSAPTALTSMQIPRAESVVFPAGVCRFFVMLAPRCGGTRALESGREVGLGPHLQAV